MGWRSQHVARAGADDGDGGMGQLGGGAVFAVVPLVVAAVFTFLPADQAVRVGVGGDGLAGPVAETSLARAPPAVTGARAGKSHPSADPRLCIKLVLSKLRFRRACSFCQHGRCLTYCRLAWAAVAGAAGTVAGPWRGVGSGTDSS